MLDREVIKNGIVFPDIYGQGVTGMLHVMAGYGLNMTILQCKAIRAAKKKLMPDVTALEEEIRDLVKGGGCIKTWGGREYYAEPPKYVKKFNRVIDFSYKILNYLIQGSAAECTKESLINYHEHPKRQGRLLLTVHDEDDISSGPKKNAPAEMQVLRECMESVPFDLKMLSDGQSGPNWGELTKYKEN